MSMNKPSGFKGSSDTCSILKDFYKTLASSVMSSKIKSEKKSFVEKSSVIILCLS